MDNTKRKRITMKLKTPNPLFEKWLTEWRDRAKKDNSKMEYCFNTALRSLKKYPLPLDKGKDCKILKGFGDKLCLLIDDKLKEHQRRVTNSLDDTIIGNVHTFEVNEPTKKRSKPNKTASPKNKARTSKEYLPRVGSGGYAILVTLYTQSLDPIYPGFLTKQEIITEGQILSHTSFTKPDPGSRYTAWASMRTLITKNFVAKQGNPPKFSLTDEGLVLAQKLLDNEKASNTEKIKEDVVCLDLSNEVSPTLISVKTKNNFSFREDEFNVKGTFTVPTEASMGLLESESIFPINKRHENNMIMKYTFTSSLTSSTQSSVTSEGDNALNSFRKSKGIEKHVSCSSMAMSHSSESEESFIIPPNSFDIILYVDTCETSGANAPIQDDPILAELQLVQTHYEIKKLKVGDYVWICRDRVSKNELVLPYIVERKRMDDFGQSIKDGRYHEQKFRLKKSGIQNVTYLIERYGSNQYVGLPLTTLFQAATNTAIQDGFCIKFTENIRDTARYLASFSKFLTKLFQSKTLVSCPKENLSEICLEDDLISLLTFKEFNHGSSKNKPMRVTNLFIKMLIQIKGMSVDRAIAIVNAYPTPALLKKAYDDNPGPKGEKLLASIPFGDTNKSIGAFLSKIVYQLFTTTSFN